MRTVQQVANSVAKLNDHSYAKLGARVRSFEVCLYGSPVKLTVVKDDTHEEAGCTKYLATNELSLTNTEQVVWYRRRWSIEVLFRDAKHLLGLGRSQARTPQAVLTHIVMVCLAYVALQLFKPLSASPHLSVSQSKNALGSLRLLVHQMGGAVRLGWLKPSGQCVAVDVAHLWSPVWTRVSGIQIPEVLEIMDVFTSQNEFT